MITVYEICNGIINPFQPNDAVWRHGQTWAFFSLFVRVSSVIELSALVTVFITPTGT